MPSYTSSFDPDKTQKPQFTRDFSRILLLKADVINHEG